MVVVVGSSPISFCKIPFQICEIICNDLAISKTTRSVHLDCIEQCLNSENKPLRSSIMVLNPFLLFHFVPFLGPFAPKSSKKRVIQSNFRTIVKSNS